MFKKDFLPSILKIATDLIPFEELSRYLPFQTRVVSGYTFNHIQSLTAYDIETTGKLCYAGRYSYTVSEGDTLCRRSAPLLYDDVGVQDEDCPGCLAIAQGLIRRDIELA